MSASSMEATSVGLLPSYQRYICEDTGLAFDEIYFPKMRELLREARKRCPALQKK